MPKRTKKKLTTEIVADLNTREVFGQVEKRFHLIEDLLATRQTKLSEVASSDLPFIAAFTPVVEWKVGIETIGRPVLVRLQFEGRDHSGNERMLLNTIPNALLGVVIRFFRDEVQMADIAYSLISSGTLTAVLNPEYFQRLDTPPAGVHTYRVEYSLPTVGTNMIITGVQLAAVPL
jgi:hypothetical protein